MASNSDRTTASSPLSRKQRHARHSAQSLGVPFDSCAVMCTCVYAMAFANTRPRYHRTGIAIPNLRYFGSDGRDQTDCSGLSVSSTRILQMKHKAALATRQSATVRAFSSKA
ncbi:hypothetical protein POSPLADRAFT_1046084 [Postia placenta MAD-698-R-SB12]|uniref:Uncharacterized protein n=1 Tax=Postia placenta MAD-698-R-SB12 TaxID=670580 RepID=A0A1X6N221_9APHY|nr:hypothetical protein POSPLADRAFT_1046084 [Postia placenta MAD-698-R-SB12]OSX62658.1 hypothetical protein POSPLADRAFT_1046084 [Postia placenta MAD-698-R-SB12]